MFKFVVAIGSLFLQTAPGSSIVFGDEHASSPTHDESILDSFGQPLGPITASLARLNRRAEAQLNLVARVEVQANEMVEFYEPAPGIVLISGAGAPDGPLRFSKTQPERSPEDVWTLVAGDKPLPLPLSSALERWREAIENSSAYPSVQRSPAHGVSAPQVTVPAGPAPLAPGWCDTGYFSSGYGACPNADIAVCLNNWWNGAYGWGVGYDFYYTNVCPAQGNVTLRVTTDASIGGIWTVDQNTVRVWQCYGCNYVKSEVQNATGDRFHFRFLAWEF